MQARLVAYIANGGPKTSKIFDCHCFAYYLKTGDTVASPIEIECLYWKYEISFASPPSIGDAVHLFKVNRCGHWCLQHSAIFIGQGMYLSKFGWMCGLYVTTLQQMMSFYNTTIAVVGDRNRATKNSIHSKRYLLLGLCLGVFVLFCLLF
jgi:hypothetical protein